MASLAIVAALVGLGVGSFVNVLVSRLPHGKSLTEPRSSCDSCHHALETRDLIPLFSYFSLRGRCRYCQASISWRYPVIEGGTAVLFALAYLAYGLTLQTVLVMVFMATIWTATWTDLETRLIPNALIIGGMGAGLLIVSAEPFSHWQPHLTGFIAFGAVMYVLALIARGGIGGGDVKLAALIGFFIGPYLGILAFIIAGLSGGIISAFLVAARKKGMKDSIPYGPFLALGGAIAVLLGAFLSSGSIGPLSSHLKL